MLPEDVRSRIREEESYRNEVRFELEKGKPPRTRREIIWDALNSGFFLWLLSGGLVTGLTTWYAKRQEGREREEKRRKTIRDLDIRIRELLTSIVTGLDDIDFTNAPAQRALDMRSEFVELHHLIRELIEEDPGDRKGLETAAEMALELEATCQDGFYKVRKLQDPKNQQALLKELARAMLSGKVKGLLLPRWRMNRVAAQ